MVIEDLDKRVAIGKELILYSKTNISVNCDLKIGYRIDKEEKSISYQCISR